jgi:hypothetical protein
MANMVFSGLVTAWRLAGWPTRISLLGVKATIEGVVRMPSAFAMTLACPPFHDRDAGIGGSEIDSDRLGCHVAVSSNAFAAPFIPRGRRVHCN